MANTQQLVTGIHHVTALGDDAQENIDFYAGILGLRLVKKTINFDAPDVYHLYYGNESGSPGTIMTFFPYPGLVKGKHGAGQMTVTSFSAPTSSLDYWLKRLKRFNIAFSKAQSRFGREQFISFNDIDGLALEIIFNDDDQRPGFSYGFIPVAQAIRGFHGVTISEQVRESTVALLTRGLDHQAIAEENGRYRYSTGGKPGDFVDIVAGSSRGLGGSGTIHHLAFATPTDATQLEARERLLTLGVQVTPVLDRQYFHSIYFREPGGVLFEIATLPPGFAIDESPAELGTALKLPSWQESSRGAIEKGLTPVTFVAENFRD